MYNIETIEDSKVFIYLPNGKHCQFRTIEAAERMKEILQDIDSGQITHLKTTDINNNEFDITFSEDYLNNVSKWMNHFRDFSIDDFHIDRYFVEMSFHHRAIKLAPYANAILFRKKDATEWNKDNIEHLFKLPLTESAFETIIHDAYIED